MEVLDMSLGHGSDNPLFLTDAQLAREMERCEYCEEKPCKKACPSDCSPADFIMAARQGKPEDFRRAASLILTANPFGGVCGGVCPDTHCQAACSHKNFDWHIEIPAVQGAIIARAKAWGVMPEIEITPANGKSVGVIGAGPSGLAAAWTLAQKGYAVELHEETDRLGGACALVPPHRLDPKVLASDIEFILKHPRIRLHLNSSASAESLLAGNCAAVVVAQGLWSPVVPQIPGCEHLVAGNTYLQAPAMHPATGSVAVIGGGAIACDCAVVAKLAGASKVEMFTLETVGELPLTPNELKLLLDHQVDLTGRTKVASVEKSATGSFTLKTSKVALPAGEKFHPAKMVDVASSDLVLHGYDLVLVAIGNRSKAPNQSLAGVFAAGDAAHGPSTVVEAVASGKNAAVALDAWVAQNPAPVFPKARKSEVTIPGYQPQPVSLKTDFFGTIIPNPFLLSAAPPSDGLEQMRKALKAGWAGGIMKTSFDGIPIHIPSQYMTCFTPDTYGNCDNVSGHPLDRLVKEIKILRQEFPDRLIGASTGGPVSGNDASDKLGWQSNCRKLEQAGAQVVEFSLSCPQGGDGTEGAIVSQNAALTAKIIDWVLEISDPNIPKLFKLTAAVTSVAVIIKAVKEVLDRHPGKKAGVTLANTFPVLGFRPRKEGKGVWDEGVVYGMSGAGVAPISNLTLASVAGMGVVVSGNGGPMDYYSAAHFLALGARSVQFCTVAEKYGVEIIDELTSGLSHLMKSKGIQSVEQLIGCAHPNAITDFMELSPVKQISAVHEELCSHCGNCTRCPYLAISLNEELVPQTDASKCVGCSLCVRKCFTGALYMRDRTAHEAEVLQEA